MNEMQIGTLGGIFFSSLKYAAFIFDKFAKDWLKLCVVKELCGSLLNMQLRMRIFLYLKTKNSYLHMGLIMIDSNILFLNFVFFA